MIMMIRIIDGVWCPLSFHEIRVVFHGIYTHSPTPTRTHPHAHTHTIVPIQQSHRVRFLVLRIVRVVRVLLMCLLFLRPPT